MKIGIFGGSFNPVHVGHAIIANYVIQHCGLDRLWLMVSPLSPFKVARGEHYDVERLRMVEMVSNKLEHVETSGFEFTLPRPSYTADTLNALKAKFPEHEFFLIIGADNWVAFDRWDRHEEILAHHKIMIYPRSGYEIVIPDHLADTVQVINAPLVEVSSTEIREGLARMNNMSFYLPDDVYHYIIKNKLYLNND
ncbi:MAG: nicotinate (nicotinamide) nucleotide adenylyltransferase [Bacteroidales bacterium]|nr:nicotinate (nicotinamide) nucleotide adenylyltransferase [Bacteroidales bacterium]